jgi:hypothetical protein
MDAMRNEGKDWEQQWIVEWKEEQHLSQAADIRWWSTLHTIFFSVSQSITGANSSFTVTV